MARLNSDKKSLAEEKEKLATEEVISQHSQLSSPFRGSCSLLGGTSPESG